MDFCIQIIFSAIIQEISLMFIIYCSATMKIFSFLLSADALTAVLTKINRLDIVTLLEGPIFDYGNISGTRCFADDSAVSQEQADGKV